MKALEHKDGGEKKLYDKENETIKQMIEESQMSQIETQLKNQTVTSSCFFYFSSPHTICTNHDTFYSPYHCFLCCPHIWSLCGWKTLEGRSTARKRKKNKLICTMASLLEAEYSA